MTGKMHSSYWEYPEMEEWDDDDRYAAQEDRCLPFVAIFIAATGPFVCAPRRNCRPNNSVCRPFRYYPNATCRPAYGCFPHCYPY